jgi:hypothetical protein
MAGGMGAAGRCSLPRAGPSSPDRAGPQVRRLRCPTLWSDGTTAGKTWCSGQEAARCRGAFRLPASVHLAQHRESTGLLEGTPLDVVAVRWTAWSGHRGTTQARGPFKLAVGCSGWRARAGAGSDDVRRGHAGVPEQGSGPARRRRPVRADVTHCGPACDLTCPRTSTNRCVGTCACGGEPGACSGATPACCPGTDGRPESFSCVSLQTPEHCGACQTACQAKANTTAGCASSTCTYACNEPWRNCNGGTGTNEGPTRTDAKPGWTTTSTTAALAARCPVFAPGKNTAEHRRPAKASAGTSATCRSFMTAGTAVEPVAHDRQDADGCQGHYRRCTTAAVTGVSGQHRNARPCPNWAPSVRRVRSEVQRVRSAWCRTQAAERRGQLRHVRSGLPHARHERCASALLDRRPVLRADLDPGSKPPCGPFECQHGRLQLARLTSCCP